MIRKGILKELAEIMQNLETLYEECFILKHDREFHMKYYHIYVALAMFLSMCTICFTHHLLGIGSIGCG